ncbi:MAG: fluoride efflux transporter CrcB [Ruminiclostridium sp.]|nr:fluoride efflux transporter CrcB [Ruminiclostridium sp.]
MEYILVGVGGIFGSLARYCLGRIISERLKMIFPLGTFIINVCGAFLLGVVNGAGLNGGAYLLLAEGFLGAYTTYSTFIYEGFNLFRDNEKANALFYIGSSLFLGIIGFIAGYAVGKML